MDFEFEPSAEVVLDELLPSYIEISIYRAILEGMASEHGARMTAMRAASDAATEMIDDLTLAMNRARCHFCRTRFWKRGSDATGTS